MRFPLILVLTASLVPPSTAHAKPPLCTADVIETTLIGSGRITQDELDPGVNLIRCGDLTGGGAPAVFFPRDGGGPPGDTPFGVIEGGHDGAGGVPLLKDAYKVGVARHDS